MMACEYELIESLDGIRVLLMRPISTLCKVPELDDISPNLATFEVIICLVCI